MSGPPDYNYEPTKFIVANPALNISKELTIGEDCVIIRCDKLKRGILPLIRMYGTLLAENLISFRVASINTRLPYVASATNGNAKKSLELMMKNIEDGKLAIADCNDFMGGITTQPYSASTEALTDLIEYHQYLTGRFYTEVGLHNSFNMRTEYVAAKESALNDDALLPYIDNMMDCWTEGCNEVKRVFGLDWSVSKKSAWAENGQTNKLLIERQKLENEQLKVEIKNSTVETKEGSSTVELKDTVDTSTVEIKEDEDVTT